MATPYPAATISISPFSFATAIIAVDALFILAGVPFYVHEDWPVYGGAHYLGEKGPLTFLSFLQLAAIAVVAWMIFQARSTGADKFSPKQPAFLWAIVSCGFMLLAVDEMFQVHERIDYAVHDLLALDPTPVTDRLDDVIVGLYGLIGVGVLAWYRRELSAFRRVRGLLAGGFALLFSMVMLDFVTNGQDLLLLVLDPAATATVQSGLEFVEEACKVLGSAVFLIAFYCILAAARSPRPPGSER